MTSTANKGIDWDAARLGELPDTRIAAALGVSPKSVWHARKVRGIPPAPRSMHRPKQLIGRAGSKRIDWSKVPLGKLSDAAIARSRGLHRMSVAYARKVRGIPAWTRKKSRKQLLAWRRQVRTRKDSYVIMKIRNTYKVSRPEALLLLQRCCPEIYARSTQT